LELELLEARNLLNGTPTNVLVNNPAEDTTVHDTQSETAIVLGANSNIVVAYNDTGSFSYPTNPTATGYSLSTNGGVSFTDQGSLPGNSPYWGAFDQVLARSSKTGTIFLSDNSFNTNEPLSQDLPGERVNIFRSLDNGATYSPPLSATPGFVAGVDIADKPWMAVDNHPGPGYGNVYLAWTDLNLTGGGTDNRNFRGIFFTRSTDDGVTWGPSGGVPIAVKPGNSKAWGAFVTVGPDHTVCVFWWDGTSGQNILMSKSTDLGQTFSNPVIVTGLNTNGNFGDLGLNYSNTNSSSFHTFLFPQAAVNPVTGDIYVVFNDEPNVKGDKADIFFTMSTDGGNTWSSPLRVNDDATTTDQWQPAIAVTPDGTHLFISWYDRRNDPTNDSLIDRYGAIGTVSGHTVNFASNFRITDVSFPPALGQDSYVPASYMGDYDMATADNNYFYTTWGDNRLGDAFFANQPDVRFAQIPVGGLQDSALSLTSATLVAGSPTASSNPSAIPITTSGLLTTREWVTPQAEIPSRVTPAGARLAAVDQLFSAAGRERRRVLSSRLHPQAWWHEPALRDDSLEPATL
jgi:hypothetical protein